MRRARLLAAAADVERLLDRCLSIDNLIDYNAPHIKRHRVEPDGKDVEAPRRKPKKLRAKRYMDSYINPGNPMWSK